jgi:hypothetical protein
MHSATLVRLLRSAACMCSALFLGACAEPTSGDFNAVAGIAIRSIENGRAPLTYVLSDGGDPRVRAAIAALRIVVRPADVPKRQGVVLPSGYALLEGFLVRSADATVSVLVGEDYWGPFACGSSIRVQLKVEAKRWTVHDRMVVVC